MVKFKIMQPKVSVIITTKNSAQTLKNLLESIKKQSYKSIETIVVDNQSSDKTVNLSKKYTDKVFNKGPERSAQRNFGVNKSTGKYVFILDSDMVLTKNVVRECVLAAEADQNIGCLVIPERSFGNSFWAKTKQLEREINQGEEYFEAARFFPKETFKIFKGYDENITGPEDWDLPRRVVKYKRISRIKSYILHNEGDLTLSTLFKKKYYYGLSADRYLKKQKLSPISSVTLYFLRPAFYRKWYYFFKNPFTYFGMLIMLTVELFGGGFGYLKGRLS